mgnify:CR=1 FL=1
MKYTLKISLIYAFIMFFAQPVFSQDYLKLAKLYYKDPKPSLSLYLIGVVRDNNAEQLVIDYQNLESENTQDIDATVQKIEDLKQSFEDNYTNPEDDSDCQKMLYYQKQLENLNVRITILASNVEIARNAYDNCPSNCDSKVTNFNQQLAYYNEAVAEWEGLKENYDAYRPACEQADKIYVDAAKYYDAKQEAILQPHKARVTARNARIKAYKKQLNEIIENTPIPHEEFYDNGVLKKEGYLIRKTKKYDGSIRSYYPNGKLEWKGTIVDGEFDGMYTKYYETGVKKAEAEYKDGVVIGSWKNYNEEGVDEQAEMNKRILDHWDEEFAADDKYYADIDNSSVIESIASNPIRTIKEDGVELVIDFSKASKETINFFLVRPDHEKSKELRKKYINDILETDGGKVSHKTLGDDEKVKLKAIYDGQIITITDYQEDGSYTQLKYQNRNKVGILQKYDKNGNRIESEETGVDINKFLSQKNFYIPAMMSRKVIIEIGDGIWKESWENYKSDDLYAAYKAYEAGKEQYTSSKYSYKQISDTQFELTFLESNDSINKYQKGDIFIIELNFVNTKSKFYQITKTSNTNSGSILEKYYY